MKRSWAAVWMSVTWLCASGPAWSACSDDADAAFWCADLSAGPADVDGNSRLGSSFSSGDYNGDGFVDLAIGRPGGGLGGVGEVVVLLGTDNLPDGGLPRDVLGFGLIPDDETLGVPPEMGASLATTDLDRDGVDDLLVGMPGKDTPFDFAGCGSIATPCLDTGIVAGYFGTGFSEVILSSSLPSYRNSIGCGVNGDGDDNYFGASLVANRNGDIYGGAPGIGLNLDESAGYVSGFRNLFVSGQDCIAAYRPATLFGDANRTARVGASIAAISKGNGNGATVVFGAPNTDNGSINELGVVLVQYASNTSTNPPASVYVQEAHWPPAGNGQNDHFGAAVAAGDFDGDGDDDAVVSAPDKDVSGNNDAGRLYLLRNDADQIRPVTSGGFLHQNSVAGCGAPEAGDRFGAALAAGYINADRFEDLVVGVPGEEAGGQNNEGIVSIIYGTASGLTTSSPCEFFREADVGGASVANAEFGSVLHVADFDRDGLDDIVVGIPNRTVAGQNNAGKVYIRRGSGASGMDVRINTTAFANTAQTPVQSGAVQATVSNTATLLAGPVEHAESMVLELEVSANGTLSNPGGSSLWRCVATVIPDFPADRSGQRCVLADQTLLGDTTVSKSFRVNLKPNQSNGEVQWVARVRGDANDTSAGNNQSSGSIFFVVNDSLFGNGFE